MQWIMVKLTGIVFVHTLNFFFFFKEISYYFLVGFWIQILTCFCVYGFVFDNQNLVFFKIVNSF